MDRSAHLLPLQSRDLVRGWADSDQGPIAVIAANIHCCNLLQA